MQFSSGLEQLLEVARKDLSTAGDTAYCPSNVINYPNLDRVGLNRGAGMLPSSLPPGPKLSMESFDGDMMKYWGFKQRHMRHIEEVYSNWKDLLRFV